MGSVEFSRLVFAPALREPGTGSAKHQGETRQRQRTGFRNGWARIGIAIVMMAVPPAMMRMAIEPRPPAAWIEQMPAPTTEVVAGKRNDVADIETAKRTSKQAIDQSQFESYQIMNQSAAIVPARNAAAKRIDVAICAATPSTEDRRTGRRLGRRLRSTAIQGEEVADRGRDDRSDRGTLR